MREQGMHVSRPAAPAGHRQQRCTRPCPPRARVPPSLAGTVQGQSSLVQPGQGLGTHQARPRLGRQSQGLVLAPTTGQAACGCWTMDTARALLPSTAGLPTRALLLSYMHYYCLQSCKPPWPASMLTRSHSITVLLPSVSRGSLKRGSSCLPDLLACRWMRQAVKQHMTQQKGALSSVIACKNVGGGPLHTVHKCAVGRHKQQGVAAGSGGSGQQPRASNCATPLTRYMLLVRSSS